MRPLLVSGLMCVPALVMLAFGWPHGVGTRPEGMAIAPAQVVTAARSSLITISLPPAALRAAPRPTDPNAAELAWDVSLAAAPTLEPTSSRPRPPRTLHAVRRPVTSVVVAQTIEQRSGTFWARIGQWLAQHEAPKAWLPGGDQG